MQTELKVGHKPQTNPTCIPANLRTSPPSLMIPKKLCQLLWPSCPDERVKQKKINVNMTIVIPKIKRSLQKEVA